MTRMNDFKNELESIKGLLTGLTTKMQETTTAVEEQASTIKDMKNSLSDDMKVLKESNTALTKEVNDLRTNQENEMKALKKRTLELETSFATNVIEFEKLRTTVSTETIELHETKLRVGSLETDVEALKSDVAAMDGVEMNAEALEDKFYTKEEIDDSYNENASIIEALQYKLSSVEFACHRSQQNSRKFNLELDGIPTEVGDEPADLEKTVIKLLEKMDVPCESKDIEAVHRLPSKTGVIKGTIIRFHRRKMRDDVLKNKMKLKKLKDWQLDIPGLTDESAIYAKPNLCPYYKMLAFNCRVLKKSDMISGTSVDDDGIVKIKTHDNQTEKIQHETKLRRMFPQFRFFKFGNAQEQ